MRLCLANIVSKSGILTIAILVTVIFSGCGNNEVTLYAVGEHERTVSIATPDYPESLDRRKLRKAWRLYGEQQYRVASELAESLFDTTCDAEARELAAIAETRLGNTCKAECGLREAIKQHPHSSNLRKALIWQLAERGRYEAAEREAWKAASDSNDLQLWDYLVVVRDQRAQSSRLWFCFCLAIWALVVTAIASVAIVYGRR